MDEIIFSDIDRIQLNEESSRDEFMRIMYSIAFQMSDSIDIANALGSISQTWLDILIALLRKGLRSRSLHEVRRHGKIIVAIVVISISSSV